MTGQSRSEFLRLLQVVEFLQANRFPIRHVNSPVAMDYLSGLV